MADSPPSDIMDTHLSEAEYRLLWETSTDAVVILDRASTIRYANPAVADVFGYRPEELVGQNIAVIQPERLREAHRRGLERYLATGAKKLNWRATEALGLHRQGHEFPIEIAFSHLSHEKGISSRRSSAISPIASRRRKRFGSGRRADGPGAGGRGRRALELPVAALAASSGTRG